VIVELSLIEVVELVAVIILAALFLLLLFEPNLPYRAAPPRAPLASREYVNYVSAIVNARLFSVSDPVVLSDGDSIYAAELEAIRQARRSIHLEVYLFLRGRMGDAFIAALTERARAGVAVRVVVDRIGSLATRDNYFAGLRAAGGRVYWYQPIAWYTLKRFNNRTHRDLLIVDGTTGFVGGVGIADFWVGPPGDGRPWRDTMVRVTGDLVKGLQTSFAENWLEASGEILPSEEFELSAADEPDVLPRGTGVGIVVNSTPSAGRSTRARILFQVLLASARRSIEITSPYFLPDRSLVGELLRAAERGVKVTVLTPGAWNNHPIARLASRRRYGTLLRGGIAIHEYQPAMIHSKVLIVDDTWCVVGSTNFDNRSFGINDEVNVAILQADLGQRLQADFQADLALSRPVTLEEWRRRRLSERVLALLGTVLERQE